jgi:dolichol-phosphate mannosyltransferase
MVEPMAAAPREVPASEAHLFRPRRGRWCVCVFVINEGPRLLAQLERMRDVAREIDVVVADGGSTDGSVGRDTLEPMGVRGYLVKRGPGKLSAQMRMALDWALDEGYDGVITIDGNNKDDPSAIPSFVRALEDGVDHVQGSRYVPGGRGVNTPASRHWGVMLLHAPLISLAAHCRYTDTTNGFRAYSRRLLTDPRVQPFRDVFSRYELHYYLAIRSCRLGFRSIELPVTREYPREGKTPTKISPVRGNLLVLRTLFNAVLHRYDPPPAVPHA